MSSQGDTLSETQPDPENPTRYTKEHALLRRVDMNWRFCCHWCAKPLVSLDLGKSVFCFWRTRSGTDRMMDGCDEECARKLVRFETRDPLAYRAREFSRCLARFGMGAYIGKMIWEMAYPPQYYYVCTSYPPGIQNVPPEEKHVP